MDSYDVLEYNDDVTHEELDNDAWQMAVENAESYGIYPECYREENGELDEEFDDSYSHNIEGSWEIYSPIKHNKYLTQ